MTILARPIIVWMVLWALTPPGLIFASDPVDSPPAAVVSLIVPPFSLVQHEGESWRVLSFGAIPLMVEVPLTSQWDLRIYPQVMINTGAAGESGVEAQELTVFVPWYFQEREVTRMLRGWHAGPVVKWTHVAGSDETIGALGAALGYGWQSASGFFLLANIAVGRFRQFHAGSAPVEPDRIRTALGLTLGYQLN